MNHQVSSIHQKIVGHSSKSEDLISTLEFINLLRTSEGMSNDLEMETFLDRNDVKLSERRDRGSWRKYIEPRTLLHHLLKDLLHHMLKDLQMQK